MKYTKNVNEKMLHYSILLNIAQYESSNGVVFCHFSSKTSYHGSEANFCVLFQRVYDTEVLITQGDGYECFCT